MCMSKAGDLIAYDSQSGVIVTVDSQPEVIEGAY